VICLLDAVCHLVTVSALVDTYQLLKNEPKHFCEIINASLIAYNL